MGAVAHDAKVVILITTLALIRRRECQTKNGLID